LRRKKEKEEEGGRRRKRKQSPLPLNPGFATNSGEGNTHIELPHDHLILFVGVGRDNL
jgi:hypothetical protein